MEKFKASALFCFYLVTLVNGYTEIWRKPRNVMAGHSHFDNVKKSEIEIFHIQHDETRVCIESTAYTIKTAVCDDNNDKQKFRFIPTAHNEGLLENVAYRKCLYVSGSTASMRTCSQQTRQMLFMCYWPLVETGKTWLDKDWVGLRMKHEKKCLAVQNDGKVSMKSCSVLKGDKEQKIIVKDRPLMCLSAKAGYIGERTNDTTYYYFKHPKFKLANFERYVRVHMVYSHSVYNRFKREYQSHNAMNKIYEHAQDVMGIVDKLYRKARVRFVISGITVWTNGDKVPVAKNSNELHGNFKNYIRGVRKQYNNFDDAIYFFDGDMFGAGGTATSHFCKQSSWNEIFIIATLNGAARLKARDLANTLTHEFAHQLNSYEHTWDPPNTCPTYHLFGGRCTLGGNDWPKGLSSNEITKLRDYSYDCLKNKPAQSNVFQCGNGKIDPGEECDCGTSQSCLQSDRCCDGQICKLKKNAECSNENCCNKNSCKWNRRSSCRGSVVNLNGNFGSVTQPQTPTKHNYQNWKITTSPGSKAVVFLTLTLFEFEEGCPFDYLKIHDGPSESYKLLGTFCRTPIDLKVEGSSNTLFVTYKSDGSHESHFKLTYTAKSNVITDGTTKYLIKDSRGRCLFGTSKLVASLTCNEPFILTKSHHLRHVKSGKCIEPSTYYGRVYPNAELVLRSDCTSQLGKFHNVAHGKLLHGLSGLCMNIGSSVRMNSCQSSINKVVYERVIGVIPTQGPRIWGPKYVIRHFGGRCLAISNTKKLYLTSACTTKFYVTSDNKLISADEQRCLVPDTSTDNSRIGLGSCGQLETSFQHLSTGSFQQISSGRCLHPLNGYKYPVEGHEMVMYNGCDDDKLKFTLEAEKLKSYVIRHSGGRCLAVSSTKNLYLTSTCKTQFYFTSEGQLMAETEKKCLINRSNGDNSYIHLVSCDRQNTDYQKTLFKKLSTGEIQQVQSSRCFHPLNGAVNPQEGQSVVVYTGCSDKRLQFKFEAV